MAETKSQGLCKDYDDLCDTLYVNYNEIINGSVDMYNEGSAFILVKRNDEVVGDRVLSVSNIESL